MSQTRKEICRRYYEKNKEKILAKQAEYRQTEAHHKSIEKHIQTEKYHNTRRRLKRTRRGIVGATGEDRFGQCSVCLKEKQLVMDHDHDSGIKRGWLCKQCNSALGKFGDTLEAVDRLITYLSVEV